MLTSARFREIPIIFKSMQALYGYLTIDDALFCKCLLTCNRKNCLVERNVKPIVFFCF